MVSSFLSVSQNLNPYIVAIVLNATPVKRALRHSGENFRKESSRDTSGFTLIAARPKTNLRHPH